MLCLLVLTSLFVPQEPNLEGLEKSYTASLQEVTFAERSKLSEEVRSGLYKLIESDALHTGDEFRRASDLVPDSHEFDYARVRYELLLTAVALGDAKAKTRLGAAWDGLLASMSRGRRIGAENIPGGPGTDRYKLDATIGVVIELYKDPAKFRDKIAGAQDDEKLKQIVDADQRARQQGFANFTQEDFEKFAKEDASRLTAVKESVANGVPKTANDFYNAALVCQHGVVFEDYALAHELSVCSMLLGNKSAAWLSGASYDRMFSNSGYPQRFATQYSMRAGVFSLSKVDTDGINDTERKAVVSLTLEQARNRKWE